ncbi:hypothetical protein Cfor_12179 [Coptotermes formosanus]|uniref:Uncharacterized protein n=1 Tax=Coptotermes formosanus TaxID=36987 RepID=A0A6L2Q4I9_COPFO|nr:hypothetical protein Cfor_12179 [Coptotermes formosanus]
MGCYVFNVAQTFSYRYCLVNQMSLVAAASTATSNCDVFGLEFGCPSLVNHHKRIYITNMTTAAMHNNQAAFTNECQCTYDICGRFFNLAYENSMHGGYLQVLPCLWDVQSTEYKTRKRKVGTCDTVATKYGVSVMEIEKKIQALKLVSNGLWYIQ